MTLTLWGFWELFYPGLCVDVPAWLAFKLPQGQVLFASLIVGGHGDSGEDESSWTKQASTPVPTPYSTDPNRLLLSPVSGSIARAGPDPGRAGH